MGILDAIDSARVRRRSESDSERVWFALKDEEREAIKDAIACGAIGTGKMHEVLKAEGVKLSKYFLEQVKSGQF